jgi:osmotically inducible protein OsmC
MKRQASAEWTGNLKDGRGSLTTGSRVLNQTPYSFSSRFADGRETNPEELVGAAHAGCFTMALASSLANAGFTADSVRTEASVEFEKLEAGWTVTSIHLVTKAKVPGVDRATFDQLAESTRSGCIISRLLNAKITLDATLET